MEALPGPSVIEKKHPGLPISSDWAVHGNGNKIGSLDQKRLISGTRSYLTVVVFTILFQWRIVPRTHLQDTFAPSLLREGTDWMILVKGEFALSLSSKIGWVKGMDSAFPLPHRP